MDEPEAAAGPANQILADNMRQLMRGRGISGIGMLREHMKAAGVAIGTSTLHRAVQGQVSNRLESLDKIAHFFDVTADQLLQPGLGRSDDPPAVREAPSAYGMAPILAWEHPDDLPEGDFVMVPRLDVHLSAGGGREQVEIDLVKDNPQAFRVEWIRLMRLKPNKLAAMRASGESMEPTIHDGDSLLVDTSQTTVVDNKVYALWYDGGERVKRLFRLPGGGLRIVSDNPKHPTLEVDPEHQEHVRIIGRVVHRSGTGGL